MAKNHNQENHENDRLKLTRRGKIAAGVTATVFTVGGVLGVNALAGKLSDYANEAQIKKDAETIKTLEEAITTGITPKGTTGVVVNKDGTAWDIAWAIANKRTREDSDKMSELRGIIRSQSDAQGYPGVQLGEAFILPADQLNMNSKDFDAMSEEELIAFGANKPVLNDHAESVLDQARQLNDKQE